MKLLLGLVMMLIVLGVIFSVADIGGNIILGYAQQYLSENMGLTLTAESITGNPVKGYRLNNFELSDQSGQKLFSAGYLSGRVNFPALFTGNIRLAEISLGGMSMDVDSLIATLQNLRLPEASTQSSSLTLTASPAYAESENAPDIPHSIIMSVNSLIATLQNLRLPEASAQSSSLTASPAYAGSENAPHIPPSISMGVNALIATLQNLSLPESSTQSSSFTLTASPAYADSENNMPDIPLDRFSLRESVFSSEYGVITVNEIGADLKAFDIDIDGRINDVPVKGIIDMGESAGLTAINRSDIALGKGRVLATGGYVNDALDLHVSLEDLDLQEMTGLYPALLSSGDFGGSANINLDITGDPGSLRVFGTIDFKGSKIYGFPVERVSTNVNYSDYRAAFSNIQANVFNVPVQGEIAAALRPNEKLSVMVKLDGTEASLDGLDSILGVPELKDLSGRVSAFSANISGHIDELSGLVNLTAPRIAYTGRALTNIRAQMKLTKSDKANVDGKFQFEGAQGYIQGSVASFLTSPKLDVTAKIVDLDVKKVQDMIPDASDYKLAGKITAAVNVKGSVNDPTVTGSLDSPEFSGWDQTITKPSINFTFAKRTLTLSKTEGTLNGMPINLSGTVGPLPSDNPSLNLSATISMTPAALKAYVPDIDQYALKGAVNAGLKVTGSVSKPSVNLVASSPNLQAMNMLTAKDIELTTALTGDLASLSRISVNASAKSITASGVTFSGLNAKIDKNGDKIILGGLNAKSGTGTITGAGTADITGKTPLDFSFRFTNLALAPLAAASGADLKGNLSGTLKVSGTNTNPAIALNANVPSLSAQGFTFTNILADISGNMENIRLNKLRGEVEGAEVSASGNVQVSPALKLDVAVKGEGIKLERLLPDMKDSLSGTADLTFSVSGTGDKITGKGVLTSSAIRAYGVRVTNITLPLTYSGNTFASAGGSAKFYGGSLRNSLTLNIDSMKYTDNFEASGADLAGLVKDAAPDMKDSVSGKSSLKLSVTGTGANVSAKGTLTVPALKAFGFNLSNVNFPLSYSGSNFASSGGTAKLYNGTLKNTLTFNVAKMTFTDNIDASGVDVNALIQDAAGGLDGKITGTGKLTMKINGSVKDKVSYSGSGNFSMGAGAITGFKWLDLIAKVHNTNGIRYANVNAPLGLQTGRLILKSGSIANAPKNDPMYRYAKITNNGAIDFSGDDVTLNLLTESSINYQLINAIQGGSKGGLEALFKGGTSNLKEGLKVFLSGGITGAEKAASTGDFRIVNLKISGKAASPTFSGLKIGPSTVKTQTSTQSADKTQSSKSLKDTLIDRAVDAVAPGLKKQTTTTPKATTPSITPSQSQPQPQSQPKTQNQNRNTRQQIEDKVKEELRKGLQKGLGGLFR